MNSGFKLIDIRKDEFMLGGCYCWALTNDKCFQCKQFKKMFLDLRLPRPQTVLDDEIENELKE